MPILIDYTLGKNEDGTLSISMVPQTNIGGWNILFTQTKRIGGTPIITKSVASGFNGMSGITITNSGNGTFNVALLGSEMSGQDPGNYAFKIERLDSGAATIISTGFRLANP